MFNLLRFAFSNPLRKKPEPVNSEPLIDLVKVNQAAAVREHQLGQSAIVGGILPGLGAVSGTLGGCAPAQTNSNHTGEWKRPVWTPPTAMRLEEE